MISSLRLAFCPLLLATTNIVVAANAQPCGPPGAYVSVGDTLDQVIATCGQPTTAGEHEEAAANSGKRIRWFYTNNFLDTVQGDPDIPITQAARYSVEFVNDKVDIIYSGDQTYGLFNFCGPISNVRRSIEQGDTMAHVRETCGPPSFVQEVPQVDNTPPQQVLDYTYQFDPTVPATEVTIKNGVVTAVK